jgi:DNA polymerase III alpha subunit (gram-positive type)
MTVAEIKGINETFLVVDTETGGLESKRDSLLEIGAALYSSLNDKPLDKFHCLIDIPEDTRWTCARALAVNKYLSKIERGTRDKFNFIPRPEAAVDFMKFSIEMLRYKPTLVGHNLGFDIGFIDRFLETHGYPGWPELFYHKKIDTQSILSGMMFAGFYPGLQHTGLRKACEYFGFKVDDTHSADEDVVNTWKLFMQMRGDMQSTLEQSTKSIRAGNF